MVRWEGSSAAESVCVEKPAKLTAVREKQLHTRGYREGYSEEESVMGPQHETPVYQW